MDNQAKTQKERERRTKAQTFSSIMRHPKLSRTFSDAVSAPIGSTKRKQAQSMLSVMGKVNSRNVNPVGMVPGMLSGGMGGPGATTTPPAPITPPSNKLLFSAAPAKYQPVGDSIGPSQSQTPAPKSRSIFGQVADAAYAAGPYAVPLVGAAGAGAVGALQYGTYNASMALGKGMDYASRLVKDYDPNEKSIFQYRPLNDFTGGAMAEDILQNSPWVRGQQMQNTAAGVHDQAQGQQPLPSGSGVALNVDKNGTPIGMKSGDVVQGSTLGTEDTTHQPPGVTTPTTQKTSSSVKTGASSTSYGAPSMVGPRDVQDAVNKNMGPAAFAFSAMADKELLKRLFPGMPEDQLPMGASLTEQVGKLQDVVRKDLNMDLIENSLANKIKTGTNLTSDLNSYIRGKDEMINNLDGMINDFEKKLYSNDGNDLRDPEYMNTMNTYGNYLYTLKGRAAQRYVDFANESINQFNSELTGLQGLYEQRMKEFETVYNQRATMTQETYNRTYAMLTDLYNNVEQAPSKALNMATMKAQLDAANATIAEAAGGAAGLGMGAYSDANYKSASELFEKRMIDPDTKRLSNNLTLDDFIAQAVNANLPVNAAIDTYAVKLADELEKSKSNPESFAQTLSLARKSLSGDTLNYLAEQYPGYSPSNYISSIYGKIQGSVADHILKNVDVYKEALKDIAPGNWIGSGRTIKDKTKWMAGHPDVPQSTLSSMYDTIMANASVSSPNGKPTASSPAIKGLYDEVLNLPDNEFASYVANYLSPVGQ